MSDKSTFQQAWDQMLKENAELRGLIAECLALTPHVSGDMEKIRVWNDVVIRMRTAAIAKLEEKL